MGFRDGEITSGIRAATTEGSGSGSGRCNGSQIGRKEGKERILMRAISPSASACGGWKQNGPANLEVLLETRWPVCRFSEFIADYGSYTASRSSSRLSLKSAETRPTLLLISEVEADTSATIERESVV